jgi:hypothetical protein
LFFVYQGVIILIAYFNSGSGLPQTLTVGTFFSSIGMYIAKMTDKSTAVIEAALFLALCSGRT